MRKMTLLTAAFLLITAASRCFARGDMFSIGLKYADAGRIDEAIVILNEEIAEKPTSDRFLALGIVYLQKGEYDLALKNLEESLKLNQKSMPAVYSLAMLYEKKQLYSKAVAQWKKFLLLTKDKELISLAKKHIKQLEIINEEKK